jgi:SAM-dependent MidA family methyltransferase
MTAAGEKIASIIRRAGPIPFSLFMETALYDAECGYYMMSGRKIFGREGDFYTSEQLQPVFGRLVAAIMRKWKGGSSTFRLAEWGAGRGEMAEFLGEFGYAAVDVGRDEAPARFEGVILSNELFDALPVDVARRVDGAWLQMHVGVSGDKFAWVEGGPLDGEWRGYAERAGAFIEDPDAWIELPVRMDETLRAMDSRLVCGRVVAIDYGYAERELRRFPSGTLMAYRRHVASADVLDNPGEQDITAHVPFTCLMDCASRIGWLDGQLLPLARWLMEECGEQATASAIDAPTEPERLKLRLQLKTILFGMGETFRVAQWTKA